MQNINGKLITLFGGSGFLGRYVAQALLAKGARLRVAGRNMAAGMRIKPLGNLGQVQLVAADVRKPATVANAVAGADMVVNLVGSFTDVDAIQHLGAANIAQAAADAGCTALVHISAIGADAESPARYARSKAAGEEAVRSAFPDAVILRPSVIFGPEDRFINRFAALIRALPVVPVIGADMKLQPVYAGDVANMVATIIGDPAHSGRLYELGGPDIFTMRQLNEWIAHAIGRHPAFVDVPMAVAGLGARLTGWLPGAPLTVDQYHMLGRDNIVADNADGLAALGLGVTPLEAVAHGWLNIYRKHGRFGEHEGGRAAA